MSTITQANRTATVTPTSKTKASPQGVMDFVRGKANQVLGELSQHPVFQAQQTPALGPSLQAGKLGEVEKAFAGMNRSQRLRAMEDLRLHDKASYDKLLQGIRDGKIENESVTLPAGIDRLRTTEWAKSEEGKKITAQVMTQYENIWENDSRIKVGNTDGHTAKTQADQPGKQAGRKGNAAQNSIFLSKEVTSNPEVLATVLAHEGQHSYRTSHGELKKELAEETDAHQNQSAVWGEFGKERTQGRGVDTIVRNFNEDHEYYDANSPYKMMAHVAHDYSLQFMQGQGRDPQRANFIAGEYLDINKRSGGQAFQEGSAVLRTDMWNKVILPLTDMTKDPEQARRAYLAYNQ